MATSKVHAPTSRQRAWSVRTIIAGGGLLLAAAGGCSRLHYLEKADLESYTILAQKTSATPWVLPHDYSVDPSTDSRLFDPSLPTDPDLPWPGTVLYHYLLPIQETPVTEEDEPWSAEQHDAAPSRPIEEIYWRDIPRSCQQRMFEFGRVRQEYIRTFGSPPPTQLRDRSPKLTLEQIVQLALKNSREYQTQKESLYLVALALTLERFNYETKFLTDGNGTATNYLHSRVAGETVNTLGIPSGAQADRMLVTAGSLLARFANNVVLTFNGPDGFASDISSDLFFQLTQPVFQRDILLNPLIQSERNVVYAVRDFTRFRKILFFDLATDYYSLLSNYRQIEIVSQTYFSLVRALSAAKAEADAGIVSAPTRIEIEQIENNVLEGRTNLIDACNNLAQALDALKIRMGLPTETKINLNLTELERLTLQNQSEVAVERIQRGADRLRLQLEQGEQQRELLRSAIAVVKPLLEWFVLRERLGSEVRDLYQLVLLELRIDLARLEAERGRADLVVAKRDREPLALQFLQIMDLRQGLISALLDLANRQGELLELLDDQEGALAIHSQRRLELEERATALRSGYSAALADPEADFVDLLRDASQLLEAVEQLVAEFDERIRSVSSDPSPGGLAQTQEQVRELLEIVDGQFAEVQFGLPKIGIDVDEAMGTAIVQRLDLMNERGRVADNWRIIKLAADDLKSVLNLRSSQLFRTPNNRPFDFSFDDSETQLALSLDLPLNRVAQRNNFRQALISFHAGRRQLMELEDLTKQAVRNDLRNLDVARTQHRISIASVGLNRERVESTRLQLALDFPDVQARDFLEAQDAYQLALVGLADQQLRYIVERARLALDLELMQLNSEGLWSEMRNLQHQLKPQQDYPLNAGPAYGEMPPFLKISRQIQRMLHYPPPAVQTEDQLPIVQAAEEIVTPVPQEDAR